MATAIDVTTSAPAPDDDLQLIGHFIAGAETAGVGNRRSTVTNPARGSPCGQVAMGTPADVDQAVAAAQAAFPAWSATPPLKRARVLFRLRDAIERNIDLLAGAITREHGKTLADARGEVMRGLEVVEFATAITELLKGEYTAEVGSGIDAYTMRQPLGVVAAISPFNFPIMVPLWTIPIALACGNTFLMKPSERDPSACLLLARLLKESGLPDGVFNVIQGDKEVVDAILAHADVQAVSFVGSTPVAEHVYRTATYHAKRVQALGGAKNHMVVMPDADLNQTVDALMGAAYGSAGERCMAISVAVVVGDETADTLITRLAQRVRELRIGAGTDTSSDMGPLITRQHRDKVSTYVDLGVEEGAQLIVDGRGFRAAKGEGGFFLGGSLFDRVTPEMRIYREEIFGPVLSIVRVADLEAALQLIDEHEFGNGTAIFTRDGDSARTFSQRVRAGMVGVNVPVPVPMAFHSFGGWKRSLFGDHHMHGPEGVRFFTRLKSVTARWPASAGAGAEFAMPTAN